MPFDGRIFRLLIASPGDVAEERRMIRQLAHRWNSANAVRHQVLLLPTGWELDSTPDMSAPGQELINQELVSEADILVAVFWNRIGTPTARYESATVEELEQHLESGKKAMIYFCAAAVPRDKLDQTQLDGVERFKKRCMNRGLIGLPYSSVNEFASIFQHDLDKEMNKARYDYVPTQQQDKAGKTALSAAAEEILQAATEGDGRVLIQSMLSGWRITAGEIELFHGNDQRGISKWKAAVAESQSAGFLTRGDEGTYLELTDPGYTYTDQQNLSLPLTFEAHTEGECPRDTLVVKSSRKVTIQHLGYATSSGYAAATRQVAESGRQIRIALDQKATTDLFNTPRPDMNYSDHSGPVQLQVRWSVDTRQGTLVVPCQLTVLSVKDPNSAGLLMVRKLQGSTTFTDKP